MKLLLLINATCYNVNKSLWEARRSISKKKKESHIPQIGYMEFEHAAHSGPFLSFPPPHISDKACLQAKVVIVFCTQRNLPSSVVKYFLSSVTSEFVLKNFLRILKALHSTLTIFFNQQIHSLRETTSWKEFTQS